VSNGPHVKVYEFSQFLYDQKNVLCPYLHNRGPVGSPANDSQFNISEDSPCPYYNSSINIFETISLSSYVFCLKLPFHVLACNVIHPPQNLICVRTVATQLFEKESFLDYLNYCHHCEI
jgi:hypothetical protein